MNVLVDKLTADSLDSLIKFLPELTICATIVLMLLMRLFSITRWIDSFYVVLLGSVVALGFAVHNLSDPASNWGQIFTGMLVYDSFTVYIRVVLLLFAVLFAIFTRISGIPDRDVAPDFYCLSLGATLGMCLMASANHLLIVFLGVEMASVPSYCLAGALKGRAKSSEAALKYAVYGAGTAGVMLYGISLLAGVLGSVHIPTMVARLAELLEKSPTGDQYMVLVLGGLMVTVGLAFKLAAVPFHFWCPDVFEGASAEVNAFLSVASKAAALALLVRVAVGLGYDHDARVVIREPGVEQPAAAAEADPAIRAQSPTTEATSPNTASSDTVGARHNVALAPARTFITILLAIMSIITCTFGNLAAYAQTNIKRLLAYSTIAHAGYMIMPVAAAVALSGSDPAAANAALAALAFYIAVYLFMNLGAFAVVALLRNALGSEEIEDYRGLIHRFPGVAICFTVILVSLIGLPPLAGFTGKLLVFASLWNAGLVAVLVVAGLNTAISLFYYLRVVKAMTFDAPSKDSLPVTFPLTSAVFIVAITTPIVIFGLWWNELNEWATAAAGNFFS